MVDRAALAEVLDEFTRTVTGEVDLEDILGQLVRAAVRVLDVAGAGVVSPTDEGLQRLVLASAGPVEHVERLQERLQDGPCLDAHRTGEVVRIDDLAVQGSWPVYQREAVEHGLHGVTAIPLCARGRSWGVLDLYRAAPGALPEVDLAAAHLLANLATSYLVVTADRDAARAAQEELAWRATHDALTGLPVRWVLLEQLAHALHRLERHPGHVAVLFLDLDGFKDVNDRLGHAAGDRLILAFVARVAGVLRPSDVLARFGGDEFVVLLEDVSGPEAAMQVAERVLRALEKPQDGGQGVQPSASIGVISTDRASEAPASLIARADSAMYRAKQAGRGRCVLFDPQFHEAQRAGDARSRDIAEQLGTALRADELELHYQPIVELGRPGLYAVEALLRWPHPDLGLLAAHDVLDAAERHGLLVELGGWVLATACRQLAAWDAELADAAPRRLFVNLSAREFAQPGLAAVVDGHVRSCGLAPQRLSLEITETGLFPEPSSVPHAVRELTELGCQLAIDDFGTGHSSLSRLLEVPGATLKVDRSFTQALLAHPEAAALVSSVLTLGRRLRRTVIVEGVEDAGTLDELVRLGCTHVQGFHLGRPAPAPAVTETLRPAGPPDR